MKTEFKTLIQSQLLIQELEIHRWIALNDQIENKTFRKLQIIESHFLDSHFNSLKWIDCLFSYPTFNHSTFNHSYFENVTFSSSILKNTQFLNCVFKNCSFNLLSLDADCLFQLSFKNCLISDTRIEDLLNPFRPHTPEELFSQCVFINSPIPEIHLKDSVCFKNEPDKTIQQKTDTTLPLTTPPSSNSQELKDHGRFGNLDL